MVDHFRDQKFCSPNSQKYQIR
ncbi:hypothetical protein BpHYR1_029913 [Brachionus plicatilis]|uniref:Uncharacterized protein n=1 Tax=Brachionus plicatilis TaxID=10195 RepID=A0A3M7SVL9_BRAPC|nr:hypothetical protein BpHYR1_029913 [Brachionus plicatilis]